MHSTFQNAMYISYQENAQHYCLQLLSWSHDHNTHYAIYIYYPYNTIVLYSSYSMSLEV